MSKKSDSTFDQLAYIADWKRKNMKTINSSFKSDFVDEFRKACKSLNIKQSDVIRKAMQEIIDQSNTKK